MGATTQSYPGVPFCQDLGQALSLMLCPTLRIWDNDIFPHRIPLRFVYAFLRENRPPVLGSIRDALTSTWGTSYGWGILNQQLLQDSPAETIIEAIRSQPNDLAKIQANLEQYLVDAELYRETVAKRKRKAGRPKKAVVEPEAEKEPIRPRGEVSQHSRAQSALIRLGKTTGCTVWVAPNDQNRLYKGKKLGDGCLESLPNLGLSPEATKRISLIDVIWLRQNAPVCAFEVETTTSVFSGLLRMSDLLALVPALKMSLFLVAPRERQSKVKRELGRPTFEKIGLSEFCRFIAAEDLDSLLSRVKDLEGYVQPNVVDTIALELDEL